MAINRKDVVTRTAVGAVYVLIMGVCTLLSWWTTLAAVCVTAGLCVWEFLSMAKSAGMHPYRSIGTVTAVCIPLAMALNAGGTHIVALGLGVAFLGGILCLLRFFVHEQDSIVDVAITVFAFLYVGLTLGSFLLLRDFDPGFGGGVMCLLILLSIWGNDAFAYLGGSAFGKHKFAPKISPKKTAAWRAASCSGCSSRCYAPTAVSPIPTRPCAASCAASWASWETSRSPTSRGASTARTPARSCRGTAACSTAATRCSL